jgi:hypothetical protein
MAEIRGEPQHPVIDRNATLRMLVPQLHSAHGEGMPEVVNPRSRMSAASDPRSRRCGGPWMLRADGSWSARAWGVACCVPTARVGAMSGSSLPIVASGRSTTSSADQNRVEWCRGARPISGQTPPSTCTPLRRCLAALLLLKIALLFRRRRALP